MTSNLKTKTKKKSKGYNIKPIAIILGVIGLALTTYIGYRASISNRNLLSVSFLALIAGLLFESFRISDSWKSVIYIFIGAYFFSLFSFLPGKREYIYNFENHIETWPFYFVFLFALVFAIINKDKVTAKLNEGITLVLSLSFIYWIIDYGFTNYYNWFAIILMTFVFILSAFSILNGIINIQLTKNIRLTLSVWSTIIMFAFAIENIIRVFSNQDIESSIYLSQGLYIGLQYFFLGISAVYIMQNYILLTAFLPSRNGNYKKELAETKKDHLDRYSDQQIFIGKALLCIIYTVSLYGINYKFHILPRNTMIWFVFFTFPLILQLVDLINERKNYLQQRF